MRRSSMIMAALAFATSTMENRKILMETNSYDAVLKDSPFKNVNLGENPIYHPSRSQKIKAKRAKKQFS